MRSSRLFSQIDDFSAVFCLVEQSPIDQTIVDDDVGFAKASQSLDCHQPRISGPRSDNVNNTLLHPNLSRVAAADYSPGCQAPGARLFFSVLALQGRQILSPLRGFHESRKCLSRACALGYNLPPLRGSLLLLRLQKQTNQCPHSST